MIINSNVVSAETNSSNTVACKIEANSVMFELLSARLYQDKPLAVIRELSTNALDAHIEAGNEKNPFHVHLPTQLEPFFSIRDFGTGMSEDVVMELYSTMGSSSKRHSNAFNGALGVGSKSPFAYTQGGAFTLSSFYNGVNDIYSIYSDSGVPNIAKLGSFETDLPNGVEVSVPVQMEDINQFKYRATRIYDWFKIKPKSNVELTYTDLSTPVFSGENWEMFGNTNSPVVVMANVAYPIDSSTHGLGILGTQGLVIYAKTGEVQMAGSREGLSYTKETLAVLRGYEESILASIKLQLEQVIGTSKNCIDIAQTMSKFPSSVLRALDKLSTLPKYLRVYSGTVHITGGEAFTFRTTRSYSKQYERSSSVVPAKLENTVILVNDNTALSGYVLNYYKDNSVKCICLDYNLPKIGAEGKLTFETHLADFVKHVGVKVVKASDKAKELGIVVQKSTSGSSLTRLSSNFETLSYTPTMLENSSINKRIFVNVPNVETIFVPVYGNCLALDDWSGATSRSCYSVLSRVRSILSIIEYTKPVNVICVPKTAQKSAKGLTNWLAFLKTEIEKVTTYDKTSAILNVTTLLNFNIKDALKLNIPTELSLAFTELEGQDNINWRVDKIRTIKQFCQDYGIIHKVKTESLTAKTLKTLEKYDCIFGCSIYSGQAKRFEKLTHIISKCKIKGV